MLLLSIAYSLINFILSLWSRLSPVEQPSPQLFILFSIQDQPSSVLLTSKFSSREILNIFKQPDTFFQHSRPSLFRLFPTLKIHQRPLNWLTHTPMTRCRDVALIYMMQTIHFLSKGLSNTRRFIMLHAANQATENRYCQPGHGF